MTTYDTSTDDNLSADDLTLDERARELIRIGEVGIANEDQQALANFSAEDFRFHGPDGSTISREELWDYWVACRAAFDEFQVTRQAIFSDGSDYVAARTTFSGVFARPFEASPVGPLEPTGLPFLNRINNVFRYNAEGKLTEEWAQYDSRLFLESLGVQLERASGQQATVNASPDVGV